MAEHNYRVIREHIGDKPYAVGDERVAQPGEVGHLIGKVLEDLGPAKAEPKVSNKAKAKPSNKSEKKDDA